MLLTCFKGFIEQTLNFSWSQCTKELKHTVRKKYLQKTRLWLVYFYGVCDYGHKLRHQLFLSSISLGNFGKLRKGEKLGASFEPPFFLFRPWRPLRLFLLDEVDFGLEFLVETFLDFFCERARLVLVFDDWNWWSAPLTLWKFAAFLWLRTLSPLSKSYVIRYVTVKIKMQQI